jgi:hypothetical protein
MLRNSGACVPSLIFNDQSTNHQVYDELTVCTTKRPRCPQIPVDVRDLMQIPKDLEQWPPEVDDEFECLNLNITVPEKNQGKLPVLLWIYGVHFAKSCLVSCADVEQAAPKSSRSRARHIACAVSGDPFVLFMTSSQPKKLDH